MRFGIVRLTTKEMLALDEEDLRFLMSASFIVNDLRFYCALLARSPTENDAADDIKSMQLVRWLWASRKLASVICEAIDSINAMIGSNSSLKKFAKSQPLISKEDRVDPSMSTARKLRNKATYHYGFEREDLSAKLKNFKPEDFHRIFAHQQRGNSLFEMGEQIFTYPELVHAGHSFSNGQFDNWLMRTTDSIMSFCLTRIAHILNNSLPDPGYNWHEIETGPEATPHSERWPLFIDFDSIK